MGNALPSWALRRVLGGLNNDTSKQRQLFFSAIHSAQSRASDPQSRPRVGREGVTQSDVAVFWARGEEWGLKLFFLLYLSPYLGHRVVFAGLWCRACRFLCSIIYNVALPDSHLHQPMMLLIRGSRKSATLACPRRFLCPLQPMSPTSLATLREYNGRGT